MARAFEVKITKNEMKDLQKYLRTLDQGGHAKKIVQYATRQVAYETKTLVEKGYRTANSRQTEDTLLAYTHPALPSGKRAYPGAKPLQRSGVLAESVVVRRDGDKGYITQIHPTKRYRHERHDANRNILVKDIAERMEKGFEFYIVLTEKVLAYLHAISERAAQEGKGYEAGTILTGSVAPRPVWRTVAAKIGKLSPNYLKTVQRLHKHTGGGRMPQFTIKP